MIENILNGWVFKKSENGKIKSEEIYLGDEVRLGIGLGGFEIDDVDVEGLDFELEVFCIMGLFILLDIDIDWVFREIEFGYDE